jgi:hypothetical protein
MQNEIVPLPKCALFIWKEFLLLKPARVLCAEGICLSLASPPPSEPFDLLTVCSVTVTLVDGLYGNSRAMVEWVEIAALAVILVKSRQYLRETITIRSDNYILENDTE